MNFDKLASEIIAAKEPFLSDEDFQEITKFVEKMKDILGEPEYSKAIFKSGLNSVKHYVKFNNAVRLNKSILLATLYKADNDHTYKKKINKYFDIVGKNSKHPLSRGFIILLEPTKLLEEHILKEGEEVTIKGIVTGICEEKSIIGPARYYVSFGADHAVIDGNSFERV